MEEKNMVTTSQGMEKVTDLDKRREKKTDSMDKSKKEMGESRRYVHTFREPFVYEDQTYTEVVFDFGNLKGRDATSIEDELAAEGRYVISPELSDVYLSKIAVRTSQPTIPFDAMEELPYVDFKKIINAARNFLVKSGL